MLASRSLPSLTRHTSLYARGVTVPCGPAFVLALASLVICHSLWNFQRRPDRQYRTSRRAAASESGGDCTCAPVGQPCLHRVHCASSHVVPLQVASGAPETARPLAVEQTALTPVQRARIEANRQQGKWRSVVCKPAVLPGDHAVFARGYARHICMHDFLQLASNMAALQRRALRPINGNLVEVGAESGIVSGWLVTSVLTLFPFAESGLSVNLGQEDGRHTRWWHETARHACCPDTAIYPSPCREFGDAMHELRR